MYGVLDTTVKIHVNAVHMRVRHMKLDSKTVLDNRIVHGVYSYLVAEAVLKIDVLMTRIFLDRQTEDYTATAVVISIQPERTR